MPIPAMSAVAGPSEVAKALGGIRVEPHTKEVWQRLEQVFRPKAEIAKHVVPETGSAVPEMPGAISQVGRAFGDYNKKLAQLLLRRQPSVQTPKAFYIGEQEGLGPLYNVVGGTHHKSTVSEATLRQLGIPVPTK